MEWWFDYDEDREGEVPLPDVEKVMQALRMEI